MTNAASCEEAALPKTTELEEREFCSVKHAAPANKITSNNTLGPPFGPFRQGIAEVERVAGLRGLTSLTAVFAGSSHPAVSALRRAEMDASASDAALAEFDKLAALPRRKIISVYAAIMDPRRVWGVAR
jgi:hypothetical protein